ncbi:MAG: prolyl oligopeptidase family serine peptidase [Clostridiales bacterium]|jgi:acetyl esterase/lipase|nr:prolyl oligopeptidase family serine peptidase [Clostridiales bacterium]
MESIRVTKDNLNLFAFTNGAALKGRVRLAYLSFHGLGYCGMETELKAGDVEDGAAGVLRIFPYYGPWSWMNREAVRLTDGIVAAAFERYGLPEGFPVVSTGGSMGGCSALIYARYARVAPVAVAADCPVCDLPFHATERPDLPRTMYNAFAHYECGIDEAMRRHSPLHQTADMPDIPYFIDHGDADTAVNKSLHSDRFVAEMRKAGRNVEYLEIPGMKHCDLNSAPAAAKRFGEFVRGFAR